MTNAMTNLGEPEPFWSAFSMFLTEYFASDQGYVMGESSTAGAIVGNVVPLQSARGL